VAQKVWEMLFYRALLLRGIHLWRPLGGGSGLGGRSGGGENQLHDDVHKTIW